MNNHAELMRRIVMSQAGHGALPVVLGDTVGDLTRLVATMRGQVIRLGAGDRINPLDVGDWCPAATQLPPALSATVRDTVIDHRVNLMATLVGLVRGTPPTIAETTVLVSAIAQLTASELVIGTTPHIADLEHLVADPTEFDHPTTDGRDQIKNTLALLRYPTDLLHSIQQILDGALGDLNGPTTTPLQIDTAPAIAIDVSATTPGQQRDAALAVAVAHGLVVTDTTRRWWANPTPHRQVLAIHPEPSTDHISVTGPTAGHRGPETATVPR